jgi:hypothetical protein
MPRRTQDELIDHLLTRSVFDEKTGCLLWQGPIAGKGYGVTCWQGKQVYIHRIAYHFEYPDEAIDVIRHTCDTPNCWRIEHLVNGTTAENRADMLNKRRHAHGSGIANAAFKDSQIIEIRESSMNLYQLAFIHKVTPSTIHYIRTRKTWKHVP